MYRRLFFLYVWTEPPDIPGRPFVWRYRVEDAITHEQRLFNRLSHMEQFLCGETCQGDKAPQPGLASLSNRKEGKTGRI